MWYYSYNKDINPYHFTEDHNINNGLLLRADWHRLFDTGLWTLVKTDTAIIIKLGKEMKMCKEYKIYDNTKFGGKLCKKIYEKVEWTNMDQQTALAKKNGCI